MKAILRNYRQSPRKTRLVADLLRGKDVLVAQAELAHLNKKAAEQVAKVLSQAVANAKEAYSEDVKDLYIETIRVDKGRTLMRRRAGWRGISRPIRRRSSHLQIQLGSRKIVVPTKTKEDTKKKNDSAKSESKVETKTEKKTEKKVEKKAPVKNKKEKK